MTVDVAGASGFDGAARVGEAGRHRLEEIVGRRDGVPRVLDERGERPIVECRARRQANRRCQFDPVSHRHVVQPDVEDLVVVERLGWNVGLSHHRERRRTLDAIAVASFHDIAVAGFDRPEDQRPERVRCPRIDVLARAVDKDEIDIGRRVHDVGPFDAAERLVLCRRPGGTGTLRVGTATAVGAACGHESHGETRDGPTKDDRPRARAAPSMTPGLTSHRRNVPEARRRGTWPDARCAGRHRGRTRGWSGLTDSRRHQR